MAVAVAALAFLLFPVRVALSQFCHFCSNPNDLNRGGTWWDEGEKREKNCGQEYDGWAAMGGNPAMLGMSCWDLQNLVKQATPCCNGGHGSGHSSGSEEHHEEGMSSYEECLMDECGSEMAHAESISWPSGWGESWDDDCEEFLEDDKKAMKLVKCACNNCDDHSELKSGFGKKACKYLGGDVKAASPAHTSIISYWLAAMLAVAVACQV